MSCKLFRLLVSALLGILVVSCSGGGGDDSGDANKTLKINIALVGPVADSEETLDSLDEALEVLREFYSQINIDLDIQFYEFDGGDEIPNPSRGSPFYLDISQNTRLDGINLVFAIDVDGLRSPANEFGISGGSPGPTSPSTTSAIAISIIELTGRDGRFDFTGDGGRQIHNDERRLAAEEMGRLIGQYLGLQDIVSFANSNSRVTGTDSVSDTLSCITQVDCRNEKEVRHNLMFPFPLREFDGGREYYRREDLTEGQGAILKANILVK